MCRAAEALGAQEEEQPESKNFPLRLRGSEPRSGERLPPLVFPPPLRFSLLSGVLGNVPKLHKRTLLLHLRHINK